MQPASAPSGSAESDGEVQSLRREVERLREDNQRLTAALDGVRAALSSGPGIPAGG
jgi:hypothetical protein